MRGLQGKQNIQTGHQSQEDLWWVHLFRLAPWGKYQPYIRCSFFISAFFYPVLKKTYFYCPSGKSWPYDQSHHKGKHGAPQTVLLRAGTVQNLHPDGERLLPSLPQVPHLPRGQQESQEGLSKEARLMFLWHVHSLKRTWSCTTHNRDWNVLTEQKWTRCRGAGRRAAEPFRYRVRLEGAWRQFMLWDRNRKAWWSCISRSLWASEREMKLYCRHTAKVAAASRKCRDRKIVFTQLKLPPHHSIYFLFI